jgi:hypothetical protein
VSSVRFTRCVVAAALVGLGLTACGPATPEYKSIWTTTTTTTTSTSKEPPIPFAQYLENAGVTGQPVAPDKIADLKVTMPAPAGWRTYSNPNLSPGTRTIAKGDTYPTAMILVFRLAGDFDVAEAIKYADADAELSENFKKLNGSKDDFKGFPSSMIECTYDLNGRRMQSYNRVVIATGRPAAPNMPGQRYLVQLTVTSFADQARAEGPEVEQIIKGFNVAAA